MPEYLVFWQEVMIPIAGMATGIVITWIVIRAVMRHSDRKAELEKRGSGADGEVDGLRGEVHQLRSELDALQERVDFTERLLAQQKDRPKIAGGA